MQVLQGLELPWQGETTCPPLGSTASSLVPYCSHKAVGKGMALQGPAQETENKNDERSLALGSEGTSQGSLTGLGAGSFFRKPLWVGPQYLSSLEWSCSSDMGWSCLGNMGRFCSSYIDDPAQAAWRGPA